MKKSLLVLLFFLTGIAQSMWAQWGDVFYATTIEGITLKFEVKNEDQKTCMLASYQDTSIEGVVTIPSIANDYTVTDVGQVAFALCDKITKIIIPNTVTYIGQGAFNGCKSLKEVVIPHSVDRLQNNLFIDCESLESFVLPSSVTYIESGNIFGGCANLVSLSVEEGNPVYESPSNSNAIIYRDWGCLVCGCQTTVIPEGVTIIGDGAFSGCPFESFEIPSGIEEIREYAFAQCENLTSITIPASVNSIGGIWSEGYAFYNCYALTTVISYIEEPFEIEESNFKLYDSNTSTYYFTTATLYVPAGTKAKYMATPCWNKFQSIEVIGGDPIDLNPIDGETTVNMPTEDDVEDRVIDNVYYNLKGNNGYDSTEGCIIINTTTDIETVDGEPGSETVKDYFTGLIFLVEGNGVIELDCQTLGVDVLNVKVGSQEPTTISKNERGIIEVAYDVTEPTYVYVYATSARAGTPLRVSASENCVKLWSLTVKPGATLGISHTTATSPIGEEMYYTLDGRKVVNPTKGVYIYKGKKLVIK